MSSFKRISCFAGAVSLLAILVSLWACAPADKKGAEGVNALAPRPDIAARLAKYSPTELSFDASKLSGEDRQVLAKLVEAARYMDEIFWRQTYPEGLELKAALEKSASPQDKDALDFLLINFGPFDRQDGNTPFIGTGTRPAGGGFYPRDMTREEFEAHLRQNPGDKAAFESPTTVIRRRDGKLTAIPYNVEYREFLEPAASALGEASALTSNPSLKAYLADRAEALLSNDYYRSDCEWIDLKDNLPEIVIGPFETYDDGLLGIKASYESFVYVNDPEEMKVIGHFLDLLGEMQKGLPVEAKYKTAVVKGLASPLNVVTEVFVSGETKAGVQTSAFVLPNDEKVRENKGSKKVFLKNMMEAKFGKSLIPISRRVLSPEEQAFVAFDAYFNEVILHEISHVLGVNYVVRPDGSKVTLNSVLRDLNSAIEEGKADIVGLYNVPLVIDKSGLGAEEKRLRKHQAYTTYLAGLFRAMRFGVREAHGRGTLVQFNYLKEKGAILFDEPSGTFRADMSKFEDAVRDLAAQFLIVEGDGSYEKAAQFLDRYGVLDAFTEGALKKLADIPVDIRPIYPLNF